MISVLGESYRTRFGLLAVLIRKKCNSNNVAGRGISREIKVFVYLACF